MSHKINASYHLNWHAIVHQQPIDRSIWQCWRTTTETDKEEIGYIQIYSINKYLIPIQCPFVHAYTHVSQRVFFFTIWFHILYKLRFYSTNNSTNLFCTAWKHALPFRSLLVGVVNDSWREKKKKNCITYDAGVHVNMPKHDLNDCIQIYHLHVQTFITNNNGFSKINYCN